MTDRDCQDPPVGLLFSDRGWLLKVGVVVGLLSILCSHARETVGQFHPALQDGVLAFEQARGKTLLSWALRVVSVAPDGFDVECRAGVVHVVTHGNQPTLSPGQRVTVAGRFIEPRLVEATVVRREDGFDLKRGLNYALSSATVLGFLYLVRRRFRVRFREGLFRSRY